MRNQLQIIILNKVLKICPQLPHTYNQTFPLHNSNETIACKGMSSLRIHYETNPRTQHCVQLNS